MRALLRLALGAALLAAAMAVNVTPTFAASTRDTITVTCSNGFHRTVSARAAHGVATALTKFNAHNHKGVTCTSAPGTPRARGASFVTISCTNGFERKANAKAAHAIVKALNAYSTRKNLGVTCSAA